ncbi:MAG: DUF6880 family protein [Janthinobacterium lividum]
MVGSGEYWPDPTMHVMEEVLVRAVSRHYVHAARDLQACAGLAPLLPEEPGLEGHMDFVDRLRQTHGRKQGFWSLLTI